METFLKLFSGTDSLQKAPFTLEDLPGKGAVFPNPEEGSSLPFQNKVTETGNTAVMAAVVKGPKRGRHFEVFLGRQGTSQSTPSAGGACRELVGPACGKPA